MPATPSSPQASTPTPRPVAVSLIATLAGGTLIALGALAVAGWVFQSQVLVRVAPDFPAMVFNTAAAFMVCGLALIGAPVFRGHTGHARELIGGAVALVAAAVLSQDLLGVDLGLDHLFAGDWLGDPRPHPTRMAPNTAAAFVLSGLALVLLGRSRRHLIAYLAPLLALAVSMIGALALAGYLLGLEFLFGWYPYTRMAVHTAAGFVVLSVGLWFAWRHGADDHAQAPYRPDARILLTGAAILMGMALVAGTTGFLLLERQVEATLRRSLELLLQSRVDTYRNTLAQGADATAAITTRPGIRHMLVRLQAHPNDAEAIAFLRQAIGSFYELGFSAIALHDARGRVVVQAGQFAAHPAMRVPLNHPPGTEFLWADGMRMRTHAEIIEHGHRLGAVLTERPLPLLDRMFEDVRGLGETGEMAVCTQRGEAADATSLSRGPRLDPIGDMLYCFPTRREPQPFVAPRRSNGQLLPMSHALDGFTGVVAATDYRRSRVIAAHGPIHLTGLGMVIKMDAAELYRPIYSRFQVALLALAGLVVGGFLLLYWQVLPLARRLVKSEREVRNLSLTDELTGLRNRRGFFTFAEAEIALARRLQRGLVLFYTDLDALKAINDTFGHAEGDRAIHDIGEILRSAFRDSDVVARIGGDEFAVLVMEGEPLDRAQITGRLQDNIERHNREAGRPYRLALSVGSARRDPASTATLDQILAQADADMYRVKQARRNKESGVVSA